MIFVHEVVNIATGFRKLELVPVYYAHVQICLLVSRRKWEPF